MPSWDRDEASAETPSIGSASSKLEPLNGEAYAKGYFKRPRIDEIEETDVAKQKEPPWAMRPEHVKQLENSVHLHEDTLQRLQKGHRNAADESLMLQYKNSLLENILQENGMCGIRQ